MRFGIYAETQCPPGKSHYDLTWEIVRQMIHADQVGFDSYSVIEHHFFPQFGIKEVERWRCVHLCESRILI